MRIMPKIDPRRRSVKALRNILPWSARGGWLEFLKLMMANQPQDTDYLKADGSSNLDNPTFRKTLELRVRMEKEDQSSVPYTDMISQKLNYRTQFFNQSASMITIGSWMNTEIGGTDKVPLDFNVAVAPFPKNEKGDPTGLRRSPRITWRWRLSPSIRKKLINSSAGTQRKGKSCRARTFRPGSR